MKAIVHSDYGSPAVLRCEEVEKPAVGDSQVLIKVRAASLNPIDLHGMRGKPYLMRLMGGLGKPKEQRFGFDLAGQVESVGRNVIRFKPGDEVYGVCRGALAEYVCAAESAAALTSLALKPENATFEQAAAVQIAGLTALQGLRDKGKIQPGQKVLINGAAGGVGTFAVQIAKVFGADVTGVCSSKNVDLVRSLGADRVIDYIQADFTRSGERYDILMECVGNHSLSACRRALNPKGVLVAVTGPKGPWLGPLARFIEALLVSCFVSQRLVPFMASARADDLAILRELIESGKVTPVIDRCYRLSEAPEAIRYLEQGHAQGKVVITMEAN